MGIIGRFTDIMSANINALLNKLEDDSAEELLEKYLRDARKNLDEVKAETATVMAVEKGAQRKLADCTAEIEKFSNYVVAALKAGNDGDARKFLTYKNELESKKLSLQKEYVEAQQNSEKMRQMTNKLMLDIESAQGKLDELKMKLTLAKQQEKLNAMNSKLNTKNLESFASMSEKLQQRIDAAEARAELDKQMEADTNDIEALAAKYDHAGTNVNSISAMDDELLKLKAELGLL